MSIHKSNHYVRDSKGKWAKKQNKGFLAILIAGATIVFSYGVLISHATDRVEGTTALTGEGRSQSSGNQATKIIDCIETSNGTYDCTSDINALKKWRAWEKGQKTVTRKVPTTAYTSRVEETDSTPCIAADGSDICKRYAKGETLFATNDWPLGTKLHLEGIGVGTVADRMNRRYTGTGRIDVYMGHDLKAARAHGLRMATLEILK